MKKAVMSLFLTLGVIGSAHAVRSGTPDYMTVSSPTAVWVTYSSWSIVLGSITIYPSHLAVMIDHANQNTKDIMIAITTSNVPPSSTFYGYTMLKTDQPWVLSFDKARWIWAITSDILQQVIVQELR